MIVDSSLVEFHVEVACWLGVTFAPVTTPVVNVGRAAAFEIVGNYLS